MAPFLSEAQRAWFYKNKPELAKEWEKETPAGKLPQHVGDKVKKKAIPKKGK